MKPDDPIAMPEAALELRSLVVIDVHGADAVDFLQGQLSNDVVGAGADRALLAGYCNPKGRLLALPVVLPRPGGGSRLLVERDLADALLQRLGMFVLRAEVTFERRDSLRCLGLLVPHDGDAGGEATVAGGALPSDVLDVLVTEPGDSGGASERQVLRWHDAHAPSACRRYIVIADTEAEAAVSPVAASVASADSGDTSREDVWRLGDISAGVPRIVAATREAFVPQMVNLQHVGGLSFKKGCYPGQEIVARMHYLGKLKRHMRRFMVAAPGPDGDARVAAGDTLHAADGSEAGVVVDAVPAEGGTQLLAVIRIDADIAALRLGGAALESLSLPYALDERADAAD